jgi:hypothetical protein
MYKYVEYFRAYNTQDRRGSIFFSPLVKVTIKRNVLSR